MRRKCTTLQITGEEEPIPKIESSCVRSHCLSCLNVFAGKKNILEIYVGEKKNAKQVGCVWGWGGILTPTLTALKPHLTTHRNGQTIIF